jgi:hypothetical protein
MFLKLRKLFISDLELKFERLRLDRKQTETQAVVDEHRRMWKKFPSVIVDFYWNLVERYSLKFKFILLFLHSWASNRI